MTYQLLISTMGQKDDQISDIMNVKSDAIIINQCDCCAFDVFEKDGSILKMYSFDERGIGLSRNSALMRSNADIIEFADDDMIFTDTYREDVLREFEKHPEADAIIFSLESLNPKRPLLKIKEFGRVSKIEALKYGCARLAVRREKVIHNNIFFSLLFGGGAKYACGEDTIFLQDCIRAGLKIYRSSVKVADVKQDSSSWFDGYTENYYHDKGALFAAALPKLCYIYAVVSAIKAHSCDYGKIKILKLFLQGIKEFKEHQNGKGSRK